VRQNDAGRPATRQAPAAAHAAVRPAIRRNAAGIAAHRAHRAHRAHPALTALAALATLTGATLAGAAPAAAQPSTDIFLADVRVEDGRVRVVGAPVNVTQRAGYDNQPWFLPDGRALLYSSERDGQTDIFRYDIDAARSVRITDTPENEYSPSLPGDGRRMLVVRWPTDMSTGALWWFTPDGTPLERARGSVDRVGYYTFADEHTLALFINDSIQSFLLADTRTGDTIRVGQDLGGSGPRTIPGERAVSFLRQDADSVRWLSRLELDGLRVTPLVRMLDGVANYTWTPHGTVLAARGATIYEWRGGSDWAELITFEDPALQAISRIAISAGGERIAFVAARE
jgi:hypothetical protein